MTALLLPLVLYRWEWPRGLKTATGGAGGQGLPAGASLLTINLRGGLIPHSDAQAAKGKLDYLHELVMAERPQFVCLQDLGVSGDVVPALLAQRFSEGQVHVHGIPTKGSDVAVIVAPGWEVRATHRHGSGRAVAVAVRKGEMELEVVSVYMPTNLDEATGVFTGSWLSREGGEGKAETRKKGMTKRARSKDAVARAASTW